MKRWTTSLPALILLSAVNLGPPAAAQDCMIGEVRFFAGNFAPRGWAKLEGQLLSVSQNQSLFSILGTTYGGNGRSTFGLPDLRGRAAIGQGQGPGLTLRRPGQRGGSERHALTVAEMPSHSHQAMGSSAEGTEGSPAGHVVAAQKGAPSYGNEGASPVKMAAKAIGASGSNRQHENMSPYLVLTPIICLQGVYPSRN